MNWLLELGQAFSILSRLSSGVLGPSRPRTLHLGHVIQIDRSVVTVWLRGIAVRTKPQWD